MGPVTRQHVPTHQARQPEGSELTMPSDNTVRQAQFLDERAEEAVHEERGGSDGVEREERRSKTTKAQASGCWVDVRVDVSPLWAALGLPLCDLFHDDELRECARNEVTSPDVEGTDHGAVQPPPQSTMSSSSLSLSTQSFPVSDDDADSNDDSQVQAV